MVFETALVYLLSSQFQKQEPFQTENSFDTDSSIENIKKLNNENSLNADSDNKKAINSQPPVQNTIWTYIYSLLHLIAIGAAVFMSWNCEENKKQDMGVRVLYAILVFLFPYIYIIYYFFAMKESCKPKENLSTVTTK
jgi:hypothetical protein